MHITSLLAASAEKAFDVERERTDFLQEKSEKLLLAFTALTGLQIIDLSGRSHFEDHPWIAFAFWISASLLTASFVLIVGSMWTMQYKGYPRGNVLAATIDIPNVDEDAAERRVTEMLVEATESNAKLNDIKATCLNWGTRTLLCSVPLVIIYRVFTGANH